MSGERTRELPGAVGQPPVEPPDIESRRAAPELRALPVPRGVSFAFGYLGPTPPVGETWDEWVIERGIAAALREGRSIDDRTARYIAAQLHDGQTSALCTLASTGAIDESQLDLELRRSRAQLREQAQRWARWLGGYCALRPGTGPLAGWNERIAAADRADAETVRRNEAVAALDALFGEQPDEQIGSVDELGWFGLVRHDGHPGGLVLSQDEQGFRHIWETDSEAELEQRWAAIGGQYGRCCPEFDSGET